MPALAGLPPQVGVYGYLLGGLGYALLGSSRQLAVGPTSAISLMIAGTVGAMAGGDAERYAQIASLAAFTVALLCLIAWLLRLSMLVRLISDSILVGFKAGAGLTIMMTQLPSLLGVAGGGHNFLERAGAAGRSARPDPLSGARARRGRDPAARARRALAARAGRSPLPSSRCRSSWHRCSAFRRSGCRPPGRFRRACPSLEGPALRLRDVEGIFPLAAGCLLLAYIEGVSAARTFAAKHGYALDPRQEFLGIGAANLAAALGHGYPVAGGLSQSAVNDKAGARTPLALVFASITLALCLLFLTGLLENLPKAVLAAVVLTAVYGLIDFPAMLRMWRISRMDFYAAAIALGAVLLLGILHGILLAALASVLMLLARASQPHVAFLGRIPGTNSYSDLARHPENEPLPNVDRFSSRSLAALRQCRTPLLEAVLDRLRADGRSDIRLVVCDLSASPHIDLAGSRMLHQLHGELAQPRHCAAHRRGAWTGARPVAGRRHRREGRRARPARDLGRSARARDSAGPQTQWPSRKM